MSRARLILAILAALLFLATLARYFGDARWRERTADLRSALTSARRPPRVARFETAELEGLPEPVQRYFRAVLRPGQPMLLGAHIRQVGQFRMGEDKDSWRPFRADQVILAGPPGFDWDARIQAAPGLQVYVHDAYCRGEGRLEASMLGLWRLAHLRGTPEAAEGELLRYLAEGAWMPTALLPSQGVRWEPLGTDSARATLTDGAVRVSLDFTFDAVGLITTILAPARPRTVKGGTRPTAWEGRFSDWQERNGVLLPLASEVAWLLPEGRWPYFRGRTVEIRFETAP
ncbi:MAG: hypothetical protein IPL96_09030 [Holophagaceae bacterium]|nr:hypothetical protein [Holophagaceae bacterium]